MSGQIVRIASAEGGAELAFSVCHRESDLNLPHIVFQDRRFEDSDPADCTFYFATQVLPKGWTNGLPGYRFFHDFDPFVGLAGASVTKQQLIQHLIDAGFEVLDMDEEAQLPGGDRKFEAGDPIVAALREKHGIAVLASLADMEFKVTEMLSDPLQILDAVQLVLNRRVDAKDPAAGYFFVLPTPVDRYAALLIQKMIEEGQSSS